MTATSAIGLFAALRFQMKQIAPHWLEANEAIWSGWVQASRARLPLPGLRQILIVARVQCRDDIALQHGLLRLLSLETIQPLVLFVLPTASAAAVVNARALREGWASLVTLIAEAELESLIRQLPGEMPMLLLPVPAPVTETVVAQITASDFLPDGETSAYGTCLSTVGNCPSLQGFTNASLDEAFVSNVIGMLQRTSLQARPGETAPQQDDPPTAPSKCFEDSDNEIWIRPDQLQLPFARGNELVVVTIFDDQQRGKVTAVQSARLTHRLKGMRIPIPPRYASPSQRLMQISLLDDTGTQEHHKIAFSTPPTAIEPWMLSAYLNRGGGGNPVIRAFAMGTGCRLAYTDDEPDDLRDIPVVWGVLRGSDRILQQAQSQNLHYFYVDHAYFNRGHGKSYRITRNRYEAGKVRRVDVDRLKLLNLDIQPWRKNGRSIIVCPPTEYFIAAHGCENWMEATLATLRLETDRPIVVREKPQPGQPFVPLAQALRGAHALVTHSSNVAIEAACLGTPIFVSPTSAAAPIGQTDMGLIETPRYPDRDEWLAHLAYSQYTMNEIQDGTAWHLLKYLEDCEFV
ncbi:hypothetical protein M2337_002736 [Sphingobium sp. B2D3A]|uniref:hypothetical protein n=1 Tax=unclassified Sphingobium TaxID=2611147 RepID=UPI002224538E|nr:MULTISPECIES: hypothetical protein [unclassified Sphingobium]MCW2338503.1 hypothetical protein [Sphingobium sp. B2D3A]MCW2384961.1 hypothetical protein [Sphingobium sp. B2D3D]